jgi:hypothetical protein
MLIILAQREFKFLQIKVQVFFKGEINAKIGWGHLDKISQEPIGQKSSDLHKSFLTSSSVVKWGHNWKKTFYIGRNLPLFQSKVDGLMQIILAGSRVHAAHHICRIL